MGEFNYTDMVSGLCRKLIDRHTHIFGINHAADADEALVFWEEAKKKEKKYTSASDEMSRIPKNCRAFFMPKNCKRKRKSGL